jgi:hypothetical protein
LVIASFSQIIIDACQAEDPCADVVFFAIKIALMKEHEKVFDTADDKIHHRGTDSLIFIFFETREILYNVVYQSYHECFHSKLEYSNWLFSQSSNGKLNDKIPKVSSSMYKRIALFVQYMGT